ncbi:hypothetical protein SAMN05421753_101431 [Planctomicrobium piriforme]|uniref:Uncharacterized protein n=2 Tax=Planctomicrobium piriforme TaxID=1576369 RepID=A0A1I3BFT7_9PLAN|nr:hypothetical protein SAMN05421753_101431 [Planctomicrobium piriforme]
MAVALVWIAGLGALTWLTANPVTLNWMQFQESDVVAVGKVTGPKTIAKTEQGEWPFPDRTEITVVNLPETGAKTSQTYLFALTQAVSEKTNPGATLAGEFFVTPTHLPNEAPLIYPATQEAFEQLKDIQRHSKAE